MVVVWVIKSTLQKGSTITRIHPCCVATNTLLCSCTSKGDATVRRSRYSTITDAGAVTDKFDTTALALTSLSEGEHTVDFELVDNTGQPLTPAAMASVTFTVSTITQVATIADLRAGTEGEFFELTGEAIISYIVTLLHYLANKVVQCSKKKSRGIEYPAALSSLPLTIISIFVSRQPQCHLAASGL